MSIQYVRNLNKLTTSPAIINTILTNQPQIEIERRGTIEEIKIPEIIISQDLRNDDNTNLREIIVS